uniref:Uncharacterized protein n=1 Tax=Glossina brevipalpis TaxID=37001 RepID=A0A1A9X549_9MUSC
MDICEPYDILGLSKCRYQLTAENKLKFASCNEHFSVYFAAKERKCTYLKGFLTARQITGIFNTTSYINCVYICYTVTYTPIEIVAHFTYNTAAKQYASIQIAIITITAKFIVITVINVTISPNTANTTKKIISGITSHSGDIGR